LPSIFLETPEGRRPQVQLESESCQTLSNFVPDESRLIVVSGSERSEGFFSARFESETIEIEYFCFRQFGTVDFLLRRSGATDRYVALFEESMEKRSDHDEVGVGWEEASANEEHL